MDWSWIDWPAAQGEAELTAFVTQLCRLRHSQPVFRRRQFFTESEVEWLRPDGDPMTDGDWGNPDSRSLAAALPEHDAFLLMINGWWEPLSFTLPRRLAGARWSLVFDTAQELSAAPFSSDSSSEVQLAGRSMVLLQRHDATETL